MKKEKNKLKKYNSFDILDAEILEEYLSKMALEGWMISNIGNVFLTFEKSTPKIVKFFVDITTKELVGDNYIPTSEYIDSCKEKNLDFVCSSQNFQVFINNGSEEKLERKGLKFTRIFKDDFNKLFSIIIILIPYFINKSFYSDSFITFISQGYLILWVMMGLIIILLSLLETLFKVRKYIQVVKKENKNFTSIRNIKNKNIINMGMNIILALFLVISIYSIGNTSGGIRSAISKDKLPLSLEDFNVDIQNKRECEGFNSSSPFAKNYDYRDSTYKEIVKKGYDEESKSYFDEYTEENSSYISYSVFESKYDKILDRALKSILNSYDEYEIKYKKINDIEELRNWGANEIYVNDTLGDKIIVYDDKILRIKVEISSEESDPEKVDYIDYNEKNINLIKSKVLNESK